MVNITKDPFYDSGDSFFYKMMGFFLRYIANQNTMRILNIQSLLTLPKGKKSKENPG